MTKKEWFNIGEYKKLNNYVGNIKTSLPKEVGKDIKKLLEWYNKIKSKKVEDIIEFHVRFETIHPFQDENEHLRQKMTYLQNSHIISESF